MTSKRRDNAVRVVSGQGAVQVSASQRVMQLGLQVGRSQAYRHVSLSARERELATLHEIKEAKAYRDEGFTWASFCEKVIGRSQQAVDEEIANYDALGGEIVAIAEQVGLSRDGLRGLRALPEESLPRLLPSGELQIGEQVISVDAEHSEAIADAIKALTTQLNYAQNRLEDAETAVGEAREQLADQEKEAEGLRTKLAEKRAVEKEQDRYAHLQRAATGEIGRGILLAASVLAELAQRCETEIPDREEILRAARVLPPLVTNLLDYGGGRKKFGVPVEVEEVIDQEAMDEVLRELASAEEDEEA
jgi:chromosome segregation ATPase